MPITMSGATITDDARQELRSAKVENVAAGGTQAKIVNAVSNYAAINGASLGRGKAGVTDSFVGNFTNACTTYITEVDAIINQIEEIDSSNAFKGPALQSALSNFIASIKAAAKDFTLKLDTAEKEIIASVGTAYQTQDSDIASDLKTDSNNIVS